MKKIFSNAFQQKIICVDWLSIGNYLFIYICFFLIATQRKIQMDDDEIDIEGDDDRYEV